MIGLKRGIVKLVPHKNAWQLNFEKEKRLLKKIMGDFALDIQHIGSTAIPGISAKPIIDILLGVESLKEINRYIKLLKTAGYEYEAPRANARGIFSSFGGAKSAEAENWHLSPALRPRFSAKEDKEHRSIKGNRLLFVKGGENYRTHHLHLVKYNGEVWKSHLFFVRYLQTHKKWAQKYNDLKNNLAKKFAEDRESYTKNKAKFIHLVMKKSRNLHSR